MQISDFENSSSSAIYHIAFIVHDLDAALPVYSKLLGTDFHPPITSHVENRYEKGDPNPQPVDVRTAFSVAGPPYIEVFEAVADTGVYGREQGEGFHHIGMFVEGTEQCEQELAKEGITARIRLQIPEEAPIMWHSDPQDSHGLSVQFVDSSIRDYILPSLRGASGDATQQE